MTRLEAATNWLVRMEKHPTPVRYQNRIWWRWRWELNESEDDVDTLPTPVARHLPKGNSPAGYGWSTRKKALNAATAAIVAAMRNGWELESIL